jgi:predicted cupin superfamily sugar epimerase
MTPEFIINRLNLKPLEPEGGFFCETYRSDEVIENSCLNNKYGKEKYLKTAIYYLITEDTKSALHRLKSDEIFHFYSGDPVLMFLIYPGGRTEKKILGNRIDKGETPQILVPAKTWQGCILMEGGKYALMGTTMAPGFDFSDYQEPDPEKLINDFPEEKEIINKLCN